jgi:hypothetical protein
MPFVTALLRCLFDAYICYHVGGIFPSYIAGVQTYFDVVTLFIALKNDPHINSMFQIGENPPAVFSIGPFEFALLHNASPGHVCQYHVKLGDETHIVACVDVDSVACGTECNAEFVNFVWEFNNMLCFRRYSMVFLPIPGTGHGDNLDRNSQLLCLHHYRAESDGWAFTSGCASCATAFQNGVRHLVGCVAPTETCACNVCRRQPPSLFGLASRTVFTTTNNADKFRLTRNVTHYEYVHAINTGRLGRTGVSLQNSRKLPYGSGTNSAPTRSSIPSALPPYHGMPPQTGHSTPMRRQSASSTRGETCIGVRCARGRCFSHALRRT